MTKSDVAQDSNEEADTCGSNLTTSVCAHLVVAGDALLHCSLFDPNYDLLVDCSLAQPSSPDDVIRVTSGPQSQSIAIALGRVPEEIYEREVSMIVFTVYREKAPDMLRYDFWVDDEQVVHTAKRECELAAGTKGTILASFIRHDSGWHFVDLDEVDDMQALCDMVPVASEERLIDYDLESSPMSASQTAATVEADAYYRTAIGFHHMLDSERRNFDFLRDHVWLLEHKLHDEVHTLRKGLEDVKAKVGQRKSKLSHKLRKSSSMLSLIGNSNRIDAEQNCSTSDIAPEKNEVASPIRNQQRQLSRNMSGLHCACCSLTNPASPSGGGRGSDMYTSHIVNAPDEHNYNTDKFIPTGCGATMANVPTLHGPSGVNPAPGTHWAPASLPMHRNPYPSGSGTAVAPTMRHVVDVPPAHHNSSAPGVAPTMQHGIPVGHHTTTRNASVARKNATKFPVPQHGSIGVPSIVHESPMRIPTHQNSSYATRGGYHEANMHVVRHNGTDCQSTAENGCVTGDPNTHMPQQLSPGTEPRTPSCSAGIAAADQHATMCPPFRPLPSAHRNPPSNLCSGPLPSTYPQSRPSAESPSRLSPITDRDVGQTPALHPSTSASGEHFTTEMRGTHSSSSTTAPRGHNEGEKVTTRHDGNRGTSAYKADGAPRTSTARSDASPSEQSGTRSSSGQNYNRGDISRKLKPANSLTNGALSRECNTSYENSVDQAVSSENCASKSAQGETHTPGAISSKSGALHGGNHSCNSSGAVLRENSTHDASSEHHSSIAVSRGGSASHITSSENHSNTIVSRGNSTSHGTSGENRSIGATSSNNGAPHSNNRGSHSPVSSKQTISREDSASHSTTGESHTTGAASYENSANAWIGEHGSGALSSANSVPHVWSAEQRSGAVPSESSAANSWGAKHHSGAGSSESSAANSWSAKHHSGAGSSESSAANSWGAKHHQSGAVSGESSAPNSWSAKHHSGAGSSESSAPNSWSANHQLGAVSSESSAANAWSAEHHSGAVSSDSSVTHAWNEHELDAMSSENRAANSSATHQSGAVSSKDSGIDSWGECHEPGTRSGSAKRKSRTSSSNNAARDTSGAPSIGSHNDSTNHQIQCQSVSRGTQPHAHTHNGRTNHQSVIVSHGNNPNAHAHNGNTNHQRPSSSHRAQPDAHAHNGNTHHQRPSSSHGAQPVAHAHNGSTYHKSTSSSHGTQHAYRVRVARPSETPLSTSSSAWGSSESACDAPLLGSLYTGTPEREHDPDLTLAELSSPQPIPSSHRPKKSQSHRSHSYSLPAPSLHGHARYVSKNFAPQVTDEVPVPEWRTSKAPGPHLGGRHVILGPSHSFAGRMEKVPEVGGPGAQFPGFRITK